MIQFKHATKSYGHVEALKEVSLTIQAGEMIFIQGHSGAGKSTLLKLIARIEAASSGSVFFNNQDLSKLSKGAIPFYRRKLGLIFQDPMLLQDMTLFENVSLPLVMCGFNPKDITRRVHAALNRVGLLAQANRLPSSLSSGEQQRVSIARAVVHKPKVLLADEPTGNLDPKLSLEIMKLFECFQQVGVTVIIASHDVNLINSLPYRKITLKDGQAYSSPAPQTQEVASYV